MSQDFQKVLVKDDRLAVTDVVKYAVVKGGQNMTCAPYTQLGTSSTQLVFNIQVPSEQTIIDRRVILAASLQLTVTTNEASANPASAIGCGYGTFASLAPFPLHQLMTVMSCTINNNTVSLNVRDALPAITRFLDKKQLMFYNGATPTYLDTTSNYNFSAYELNNPHAGYYNSFDANYAARGSFLPTAYSISTNGTPGTVTTEVFTWSLQEPLLISPFIYGAPKSNNQGFYGVQNMNFVFNLGDTSRVFRGFQAGSSSTGAGLTPAPPQITSVLLSPITGARLFFEYLTPHPSDMIPAKNIVPYYELPRYITTLANIPAATTNVQANGSSTIQAGVFTNNTQTIQLNQIPDKLILYVRKQGQTWGDPDTALVFNNININFNNNSGILASAQPIDLWKMSHEAGIKQSWLEWSGVAASSFAGSGIPNTPANARFGQYLTSGSYLCLEFGKDIQLIEDYYAPGSLGNFNLQVNFQLYNYGGALASAEVVMITMNSGVFVNERGTSSTYTGILTKQDVLDASKQEAYTRSEVQRMVGGGFLDMLKSGVQKLAPLAGKLLEQHGDKLIKYGADYLKKQGKGPAGGPAGGEARGMARGRLSDRYE